MMTNALSHHGMKHSMFWSSFIVTGMMITELTLLPSSAISTNGDLIDR